MTKIDDVIVIGAGPVGLYAAQKLKGYDVKVLEAKPEVGNKACSGLISTRLKSFLPGIENSPCVEHIVSGCRIHSPNASLTLKKQGKAAYVLNRKQFNQWLLEKTHAQVQMNTRVKSFEARSPVHLQTSQGEFVSQVAIGCDGSSSVVRNKFNQVPKEFVTGLIGLTGEKDSSELVDLWFNPEELPDGFYWKIPRGDSTEYGMLGSSANFKLLEKKFGIKNYKKEAAAIPIGPSKTYFDRSLLIGDSAGITKPWSGGGIIYGFTCVEEAKQALDSAFNEGDFSEQKLSEYEKLWKKKLWKNILVGLLFRKMFKHMKNAELDKIVQKLESSSLKSADMDFPAFDLLM